MLAVVEVAFAVARSQHSSQAVERLRVRRKDQWENSCSNDGKRKLAQQLSRVKVHKHGASDSKGAMEKVEKVRFYGRFRDGG
jgi:hypothetical protein